MTILSITPSYLIAGSVIWVAACILFFIYMDRKKKKPVKETSKAATKEELSMIDIPVRLNIVSDVNESRTITEPVISDQVIPFNAGENESGELSKEEMLEQYNDVQKHVPILPDTNEITDVPSFYDIEDFTNDIMD